jgi:hypothetical protein
VENNLIFGYENKNSELEDFTKMLREDYIQKTIRTIQFRKPLEPFSLENH